MANIITELHLEMNANWYVQKKLNSIGRVGENTVTKLIIEPTEILDNVTYEIEIADASGSKNVAELTVDEDALYLILTANMLTTSGIMKMQVRGLFTDGSIKKSNIFELKVNRSISATEAYEEYAVTIFDQLVAECRDIIEGAESYAVRAETAAVNAEAYSEAASASATTASTAANNASASATSATSSATVASNSATSASASATSAVTSETNAAASAALASTSATNAANSATAAATSATNAHNSEVNASTSETNASTSATEAAASAESIAASVAQINENTYRINDLEAIIAGYQLTDLPTGAVANITDGTALLMPSLKVGIEPVQEGSGDPSPDNIRPISGWTEANVTRCGKNLFTDPNIQFNDSDYAHGYSIQNYPLLTKFLSAMKENIGKTIIYSCNSTGTVSGVTIGQFRFFTRQGESALILNPNISVVIPNIDFENDIVQLIIYGSTSGASVSDIQIELGDTATTYEPYNGQTYTIEFKDGDNPLTVYGGTLDVTSGELTVTDAYIASYNGETLPSTWISDRDVYAEGATPTTGAEVVYKLANSVTYQLTPTQIRTLVGNNNIWADTGDIIEGKYFRSLV